MNDEQTKLMSYFKRATAELIAVRAELSELKSRTEEPIAIVGIACRAPGGIETPEAFGEALVAGRSLTSPFPSDREWDSKSVFRGVGDADAFLPIGGFLEQALEFDAAFFGISPREALAMDPQQRCVLELAWEALESAGVTPRELRGTRAGVFIGSMYSNYGLRVEESPAAVRPYLGIGSAASVLSGRVAYTLGLEGPAISVDTACSSSLVALHHACVALRTGECETALAGGVTVMSTPSTFTEFAHQGGLAKDGVCRSYGEGAEGTVFGEGAGVLLLTTKAVAQERGWTIQGLIEGSAIGQDGASNGLTAPRQGAQEDVIRRALEAAHLTSEDVDAIEGHGTGTRLGDPVECSALQEVFKSRSRPLWLGSAKSNLGHAQAAAGVLGVIKMLQAMDLQTLAPTLNADKASSHVDWEDSPLRLLQSAREWERSERPRRAGVSSFGVSGTNAHLIVREAPLGEERECEAFDGELPWLLSARTPHALREQASRLLIALDERAELSLNDVSWTLATGRESLGVRAALCVGDPRGALRALSEWNGATDAGLVWGINTNVNSYLALGELREALGGSVPEDLLRAISFGANGAELSGVDAAPEPQHLLQLWLLGVHIKWAEFWSTQAGKIVRLPAYPFERKRYWLEAHQPPPPAPTMVSNTGWGLIGEA